MTRRAALQILIDVPDGRVDDEFIATLMRAGHIVERGNAAIASYRFDLVIVDCALAAGRQRLKNPTRAVIVFTRDGDIEERIRALEAGASDAIDRFCSRRQSTARIAAAARTAAMLPRPTERLEIDGCVIDLQSCSYALDGCVGSLTKREVDIVRWLAQRAGQVVSRGELLLYVWRVSPRMQTRAVDVAIATLRRKLERDPANPTFIVSVKGAGYRWGSSG